jgi:UDP-N-acetylmuramoyl-L-alanyl-D-glutamate--2,6-diaminopimelate ligase
VLGSLRELPHRSLRVLFGCGGDRDRAKRPLMGEVACKLADYVVVTTDNPRTEDPAQIIDDIGAGMTGKGNVVYEPDRRKAIGRILGDAGEGDIVLIAGKGHETYQDLGSRVVPFDDREVVREYLDAERNGSRGV